MIRDRDIRPHLRALLTDEHARDSRTRIVDEMPICQARARADVAVVNGELAGFEIKSDVDRLSRLASQSRFYGRIFDRVAVVCTPRHVAQLRRRLPTWWGLWTVETGTPGCLEFCIYRPSELNLEVSKRDRLALLRRDEMADVLHRRAGLDVRRMNRMTLTEALEGLLDDAQASTEVRHCLFARAR